MVFTKYRRGEGAGRHAIPYLHVAHDFGQRGIIHDFSSTSVHHPNDANFLHLYDEKYAVDESSSLQLPAMSAWDTSQCHGIYEVQEGGRDGVQEGGSTRGRECTIEGVQEGGSQ